jgi:hypothetical protein
LIRRTHAPCTSRSGAHVEPWSFPKRKTFCNADGR